MWLKQLKAYIHIYTHVHTHNNAISNAMVFARINIAHAIFCVQGKLCMVDESAEFICVATPCMKKLGAPV